MNRKTGSKPKTLRKDNTRSILNLFRTEELLSATDIIKMIHLSKPTIMKILDQMEQKGLIINQGKGESSDEGGRKPNLYMLNARKSHCVAFHIFPHEIYGVITDLNSQIINTVSRNIDSTISFDDVISLLVDSIRVLCQNISEINQLTGIAIGSHGATDSQKGVTFYAPHFHNWGNHADFRSHLSRILNTDIPILVDNQIRFQLLSERIRGKNKDSRDIIVIEAGVGLVAGILTKNEIKRGIHFLAGEIGHMIINPEGEECPCGGKGCFEAMVTTDRILNKARQYRSQYADSLIFQNRNHENLHIFDVFSASNNGDTLACSLMDDLAYWFAIGLVNLQLAYDPESIIIQGVYSQAGSYFLNSLQRQIRQLSPLLRNESLDIRLSLLGKERSVIGATWLLAEDFFNRYTD